MEYIIYFIDMNLQPNLIYKSLEVLERVFFLGKESKIEAEVDDS